MVQESATGPGLFKIFMNELCKVIIFAKPSLFADDFKIMGDITTPGNCKLMQVNVEAIATRSVANKMPISLDKCTSMHYGKNNPKWLYVIHKKQ